MDISSPDAILRRAVTQAQIWWRDNSPSGRDIARKRAATDAMLGAFARELSARFDGTVLLDASWDNPNYWLRVSLLRAALGLCHAREIGLLGEFRRSHCRDTLERFGVKTVESYPDIAVSAEATRQADALLSKTKSADDILDWKLPGGIDPVIFYDGILKRQRLAAVDIRHPSFPSLVHDAVVSIERGRRLLDKYQFDLLVVSHPFNYTLGSLAWQALASGVDVVLPFGAFGTLRFTRFKKPRDLFRYHDRPDGTDIDALPAEKADVLAALGRIYLDRRLAGMTADLPSQYAFQKHRGTIDRAGLCDLFGWDPEKLIVGFYASNWYDWPHQLGMTQFRDFLDWTSASYAAATVNTDVNWLFKPHPAEDWFGGTALADIFAQLGNAPHIRLAKKTWNNSYVLRSLDALITYHGTAGIEFASLGKPVLVPDRGNYDECGFVKVASSRADYLALLNSEWWHEMDLPRARRRAEIFAGWWLCMPDWQGDFILSDDARQDALYDTVPGLLQGNRATVDRELQELRKWWQLGKMYYHTNKMAAAAGYRLSNVTAPADAPTRIKAS